MREGRVMEVPWNGTRAVMATVEHLEYVKSMRPRFGERYSHNHETTDNPRGVCQASLAPPYSAQWDC